MKKYLAVLAAVAVCAACMTANAANIALGKSVTGFGTFGVGGWGSGVLAPFSTVTDGVLLSTGTQWDQNTVWWDERQTNSIGNSLVIALGGDYVITGFTVQADDNDTYRIQYWDSVGSTWVTAWDIPGIYTYGMETRSTVLGAPITTSGLRFTATGGDQWYSVSEIQAEGSSVPDAGTTVTLLAGALACLGLVRRRCCG